MTAWVSGRRRLAWPLLRLPGQANMNQGMRVAFVAVLLSGCVGAIDHGETSGPGSDGTLAPAAPAPAVPGRARIWRLTNRQYDNTVADLLGDRTGSAGRFLADVGGHGFANSADLSLVTQQAAVHYQLAAQRLARDAVADDARLAALLPCKLGELPDDGCARRFIQTFGRRAFRRPLQAEEVTGYFGLYAAARGELDARTGIQLVIETMLQSPSFLFRTELGTGGRGAVRLDPYETAAALSYYLWDTMPDERLMGAADQDALGTRAQIQAQVARLLEDRRARPVVAGFFTQILDYPELAFVNRPGTAEYAAIKASMAKETETFVEDLVFGGGGDLATLLTATHTFADAALARVYGVAPPAQPFARVALDPAQRAGILTHPGFLSVHALQENSGPPRRGRFVLEKMICQSIPDPPDDVPLPEKKGGGPETTRQFFERVTAPAACAGCHNLLNPAGFVFENYDQNGRFRTTENGLPVDASVDLAALPALELAGRISGTVELAKLLARHPVVRPCLVRQAFRFAFGRGEGPGDARTLDEILSRFRQSGETLKELPAAIASSEAFVTRVWP